MHNNIGAKIKDYQKLAGFKAQLLLSLRNLKALDESQLFKCCFEVYMGAESKTFNMVLTNQIPVYKESLL
jgi:hypothetical protein